MINLIEQAHEEAQVMTQKMKVFEEEVLQLRGENQVLTAQKDKHFAKTIEHLNEQLDDQDSLIDQVKQLQEENEEYLGKLSKQDELVDENQQLIEKIREMKEELENNQKAVDYYQNDMLPSITKNTRTLDEQCAKLLEEIAVLKADNQCLKENVDG